MRKLRIWLLAVLCLAALSVGVSAAGARVETMQVALTVDENGTARVVSSLHVTIDGTLDALNYTLGPNVSGVEVAGYPAKVSRVGGKSVAKIASEGALPASMDLNVTYTIRNTVTPDSDTQHFDVCLLGGIAEADIQKFTVNVQMPTAFSENPEFVSGYYADGIDNYLVIHVSDQGLLTASCTETMLAGETLQMKLDTAPSYFTLHNVAGRTLTVDKILLIVLAVLGLLYWWRALRSPFPRFSAQSQPPVGVEPGVVGLLLIGQKPDLALMVLNWAACGYLRVNRLNQSRVALTCLIPMGNERSAYEQAVFGRLFAHVSEVACGSRAWNAAQKKAVKAAAGYWNGRMYEENPGRPGVLRTIAVLICGVAALYCADRQLPSMELRLIFLALCTLAGLIWGTVLQLSLMRLPMRRRGRAALSLACCLALMLVAWYLSGRGFMLPLAVLASATTELALLFGPKRKPDGVAMFSELLSWRHYLSSLTPNAAQSLLKSDPHFYYKTLLFAEALGVGRSFSHAFESFRLEECAFLEQMEFPFPRQAVKFRASLLELLAAARGERARERTVPKPKHRPPPKRRPTVEFIRDTGNHEGKRNNNPRRKPVETYEPLD